MAYIYKKLIHGKPYYYLRTSKRIKGKVVVKDIAYLGNNLSKIKTKLSSLQQYKKEIRKAHRNIKKYLESQDLLEKIKKVKLKENKFIDKEAHQKIEAIKEHYKKFSKIDKKTKQEIFKNFLIDFAFNTTSLEGNTITLEQADKLLKENLAPKNKTLREIHDLQNTEKVFFSLNLKEKLTHEFIISIHDSLLQNIDKRKGYRTHDIRVFRATFKATPSPYIKTDMNLLIKWYQKHEKENKLHPFALAAIFHQQFEKIHPFADGNGRTGRILMNWMLMKKNYPPVIVRKRTRAQYLNALEKGNKAGLCSMQPFPYKPFINYLAKELNETYWNNFLI